MSLRVSGDADSMPIASIQQPDLRRRSTNAGSVRLSARALPNQLDVEVARDQLVAEARERLGVERDGVAPQVEVRHAQLTLGARDLVDDHLRVALAELVALVDRRDTEVARVRAAAAGLDDDVRLARERQRVVRRAAPDPTPGTAWSGSRRRCPWRGAARPRAATAPGQAGTDAAARRERRRRRQRHDRVLGLADDHRVDLRRARHRHRRHCRGVRTERHQRRAEVRLQPGHLLDVRVERRRGAREDDQLGAEAIRFELRDQASVESFAAV